MAKHQCNTSTIDAERLTLLLFVVLDYYTGKTHHQCAIQILYRWKPILRLSLLLYLDVADNPLNPVKTEGEITHAGSKGERGEQSLASR